MRIYPSTETPNLKDFYQLEPMDKLDWTTKPIASKNDSTYCLKHYSSLGSILVTNVTNSMRFDIERLGYKLI
jgi:hypothetical protein